MTKFGNTRSGNFSSKLEAAVYDQLWPLEKAGEIKIECQDHVYLTEARIHYIAHFKITYTGTGVVEWAEAKGFSNDRWPTIKKLWKFYGPGRLIIWQGTYRKPVLTEVIIPRGWKNG